MPTLTLAFRGSPVATHSIEAERLVIGSHPECDIHVNSLAVASKHAEILQTADGYRLRALDAEYPISINGQPCQDTLLHHGDSFPVGDQQFLYSEDGLEALTPEPPPVPEPPTPPEPLAASPPPAEEPGPLTAALQILNGPRIGRVLPLDKPRSRLTRGDHGEITLSQEGPAYVLDARRASAPVQVDGVPVGDEPMTLHDGQEIQIGPLRLWFFLH
jgi:hypothetical protein